MKYVYALHQLGCVKPKLPSYSLRLRGVPYQLAIKLIICLAYDFNNIFKPKQQDSMFHSADVSFHFVCNPLV